MSSPGGYGSILTILTKKGWKLRGSKGWKNRELPLLDNNFCVWNHILSSGFHLPTEKNGGAKFMAGPPTLPNLTPPRQIRPYD